MASVCIISGGLELHLWRCCSPRSSLKCRAHCFLDASNPKRVRDSILASLAHWALSLYLRISPHNGHRSYLAGQDPLKWPFLATPAIQPGWEDTKEVLELHRGITGSAIWRGRIDAWRRNDSNCASFDKLSIKAIHTYVGGGAVLFSRNQRLTIPSFFDWTLKCGLHDAVISRNPWYVI